jgi:hypothetical protein
MNIVQIIEDLREELVELGISRGLQDPEVIRLSQKLDKYINMYYRSKKRARYLKLVKILNENVPKTRPGGGFYYLNKG